MYHHSFKCPCNFLGKIIKDIQISLISNVPIKLKTFHSGFSVGGPAKDTENGLMKVLITKDLSKDQYINFVISISFLKFYNL